MICNPVGEEASSESLEKYALTKSLELLERTLTNTSLPAATVVTVLSFFASPTALALEHGKVSWPLSLFNAPTALLILNCMQSTFSGYTNEFAYLCMQGALAALALHLPKVDYDLCPVLLQIISAVPAYFRAKPAIHSSLCTITNHLASIDANGQEEQKQFGSWLLAHLASEITYIFDVSNQFAPVDRSTNSIRSFNHAQSVLDKSTSLLSLLPSDKATNILNVLSGIAISYIERQPASAVTTLAVLADFVELQNSAVRSILESNIANLSANNPLDVILLKILSPPTIGKDDAVDALNKSIEHFGSVSATASLISLVKNIKRDVSPLQTCMLTNQQLWLDPSNLGTSEAFSSLASFSRLSANLPEPHAIQTVVQLIKNVANFNIPHRAPSGIDGPTWKYFAALFETARWTALESLCSTTDILQLATSQASEIESLIESCLERSENAHKRDLPSSMNVLKFLLRALTYAETEVSCDTLSHWFDRLEQAGRQEKTFSSKVVFFVMGVTLQPSLLLSRKYASSIHSYIDTVFEWAEPGIGPANWLIRLIEYAITSLEKGEVCIERSLSLEEFAISMIPTFKRLLQFSPERASNVQTPANVDIQLAGLQFPSVPHILTFMGQPTVSHSEAHIIQASYLRDSQVRFATAACISLLLSQNLPDFSTKLLLHLFGYPLDLDIAATENGVTPEAPVSPAATQLYYTERKGSVPHMRQYHAFQLAPFIATRADPKFLLRVLWPILGVDHLSSVRELITLSASIFISRIISGKDTSVQQQMMQRLANSIRAMLALAPKSANEDGLFAWISLAGYTLQQVDLEKQPHLHQSWRQILMAVMPFLSFNTLYIRSTTQDVILSLLETKEQQIRRCLSEEFVEWLLETRGFIRGLYEMRPLNRTNRREAFSADFLQYFGDNGGFYHKDPREGIIKTLELIFSVHPAQHDLSPTEKIDPSLINYECGRILLDNPDKFDVSNTTTKSSESTSSALPTTPSVVDAHLDAKAHSTSQSTESDTNQDRSVNSASPSYLPPVTFQRKIVPWQNMDLGDAVAKQGKGKGGDEDDSKAGSKSSSNARQEIVIVASLLKKMPNLGGLTRTAEIFAASKLILPSMAVVQDKTFQDLAVSADVWLPMEAVSDVQLKDWLLEQKRNGFSLIGLEQTSTSHPLQEYTFPQKTVLLLGNEKRGIPVDLLQLLDASVEIPQLGLIRSLNVHVSASICIWEYTKQNL